MDEYPEIRRVVTGHDPEGKAIVLSDGPLPHVTRPPMQPGLAFHEIWNTAATPAPVSFTEAEPTDRHRRALGGVPFVESTLPGQCLPVVWGVTSLLGGFFSFPSRRPCVLCLCRPRRRCSHVLHPCALRAQSLPSCL